MQWHRRQRQLQPTGVNLVNPPVQYTAPQFSGVSGGNPGGDARIFKAGGKSYLFVAAIGLGDVYEIATGDTVTARVKQVGHSANSSAAGLAAPAVGPGVATGATGWPVTLLPAS